MEKTVPVLELEIYLIRHGEPEFPGGGTYCIGTADFPLFIEQGNAAAGISIGQHKRIRCLSRHQIHINERTYKRISAECRLLYFQL